MKKKHIWIAVIAGAIVGIVVPIVVAALLTGVFIAFFQFLMVLPSDMANQAKVGRIYMDSLTDADIQAYIARSTGYLASMEYRVNGHAPVPDELRKVGIIGISLRPDVVSYDWLGTVDTVCLSVRRRDNGEFTVVAVYSDYEEKVIWPRVNASNHFELKGATGAGHLDQTSPSSKASRDVCVMKRIVACQSPTNGCDGSVSNQRVGLDDVRAHINALIKSVHAAIKAAWVQPTATACRCEIRFTLNRSGEVSRVCVAKLSGNRSWNVAAIEAVQKARYPAFPANIRQHELEFEVPFETDPPPRERTTNQEPHGLRPHTGSPFRLIDASNAFMEAQKRLDELEQERVLINTGITGGCIFTQSQSTNGHAKP